jgi:hypothetical protein
MRIHIAALILAHILIIPFSFAGGDHGSNPQTATRLTFGVATSGNNASAGDVDYFKFDTVANHIYTIQTSGQTGLSDTILRLIEFADNQETILIEKDEVFDEEVIVWRAPQNGTYYLSVSQFFSDQLGEYDIMVEDNGEAADDFGDTPAGAHQISTDGSNTAGQIDFPGDLDVFAFDATAEHFYRIETLLLEEGVDTILRLIGADTQTQLAEDDQSGRELNASRIIVGVTLSGFYYPEVRLFFESDVGGYAISVTGEAIPANVTTEGTAEVGSLSTEDDIAIYQFDGLNGKRYVFDVSATSNLTNNFSISLLAPDRTTSIMAHSFASSATVTWECPADGTYFIVLEEALQGGDYTLKVTNIGFAPPKVDLNLDGIVDKYDLLLLSEYWLQEMPN